MNAIRNNKGQSVGVMTESGKITTLRDERGRVVGTYDSKTNITRDANGRSIGTGNLLTMLITI
jgi:hypothetical protein